MLIHCPTCSTSYDVKPSTLGATRRSVRCVRCRTVWFASARPAEPLTATVGEHARAGNQAVAGATTGVVADPGNDWEDNGSLGGKADVAAEEGAPAESESIAQPDPASLSAGDDATAAADDLAQH